MDYNDIIKSLQNIDNDLGSLRDCMIEEPITKGNVKERQNIEAFISSILQTVQDIEKRMEATEKN
jgi:hypothetical protein